MRLVLELLGGGLVGGFAGMTVVVLAEMRERKH
jgi:hypothetical protein